MKHTRLTSKTTQSVSLPTGSLATGSLVAILAVGAFALSPAAEAASTAFNPQRTDTDTVRDRGTDERTPTRRGSSRGGVSSANANGNLVAKVSVVAPLEPSFILEATLPVPPGTYLQGETTSPLSYRTETHDVTTQIEVVSWYPDPEDGADVVELIGRVRRPDSANAGDEIEFDVVASQLANVDFLPSTAVEQLVSTPGSLRLTAKDLHGNGYTVDLLAKVRVNDASVSTPRDGTYIYETRSHEVMRPDANSGTGASAPYPHLLGVHVFARQYANMDFLALDLTLHNAMFGKSASTLDDAICDAYFDSLDLHMPPGWTMGWAIETPAFGDPEELPGETVQSIVRPLRYGQFHNVPQQSQFNRRLIIARDQTAFERGMRVLRRETRGFCVPGSTAPSEIVDPEGELWSWWNPITSRFLTSNSRLPVLTHLTREEVTAELQARYDDISQQVSTGSEGNYPLFFELMGWAQPYGTQYGGMTGGDEIEMVPGIDVAWSRSSTGLRMLDQISKAYIDRQRAAIFELDGHPPTVEEHILLDPQGEQYVPGDFYLRPLSNNSLFGFNQVDWSMAETAYLTGRVPHYEKDLRDFQPIDLGHLTRFLNPQLGLVWMANDSLAKLQLELVASLHHFSFHRYKNSAYNNIQGTGLLRRMLDAADYPGRGANFGRTEAWSIVGSVAHYATTSDPAERQRLLAWFEDIARAAADGQSVCTGNPTSVPINKAFKGAYLTRQSFEASYMLNAAHSLRTSVFDGHRPGLASTMRDYVTNGAYSTINAPFWSPEAAAQYRILAVRPRFLHLPEFCENIPENGYEETPFFDKTTGMAAWAYAYEATGDGIFLQRAMEALGQSGNALLELESFGTHLIYEIGPLLSVLQSL